MPNKKTVLYDQRFNPYHPKITFIAIKEVDGKYNVEGIYSGLLKDVPRFPANVRILPVDYARQHHDFVRVGLEEKADK